MFCFVLLLYFCKELITFIIYLTALPVVTGVLHWLMFVFWPESPSWLYLFKKDREAARAGLYLLNSIVLYIFTLHPCKRNSVVNSF